MLKGKFFRVMFVIFLSAMFFLSYLAGFVGQNIATQKVLDQEVDGQKARMQAIKYASQNWAEASDFSPWSFITWAVGSLWSREKNFEESKGAYVMMILCLPQEARKFGLPSEIPIDPGTRLGQMCEAGIKFISFLDLDIKTKFDVSFHKDRDRKVKEGSVDIEFTPMQNQNSNVTQKKVLWRDKFNDVNGIQFIANPPISVNPDVADEWKAVVQNALENDSGVILTCNIYVDKPTCMKAAQSFQVVLKSSRALAMSMNYQKNGLGRLLAFGDKQNNDRQRQEKGVSVKVLVKKSRTSDESFRPAGLAIYDSLGEVSRGDIQDGQEIRVIPEKSKNVIRITQLESEIPLTMYPESLIGKDGKQNGFIKVSDKQEILIYPADSVANEKKILKGQAKVYAEKGSHLPFSLTASGEKSSSGIVNVDRFGGKVFNVWSGQPQTELSVTVGKYTQKITAGNNQAIFNFASSEPTRNYSRIGVNPAVSGGLKTRMRLKEYARNRNSHFYANLNAIEVDDKEIEALRASIQNGTVRPAYVDKVSRTVTCRETGEKVLTTTKVRGLTECGSNGMPLGHQINYKITFNGPEAVWVAPNRYGWVPGFLARCGNAVMIYIEPPQNQPQKNISLTFAPPPEEPANVSWDQLILSTASIQQSNLVITPSSIATYVPQAKFEINQSQTQNQAQTLSNVNDLTNVTDVDVDVDNNNILQNQTIINTTNTVNK